LEFSKDFEKIEKILVGRAQAGRGFERLVGDPF
jgi:hypothetical protein